MDDETKYLVGAHLDLEKNERRCYSLDLEVNGEWDDEQGLEFDSLDELARAIVQDHKSKTSSSITRISLCTGGLNENTVDMYFEISGNVDSYLYRPLNSKELEVLYRAVHNELKQEKELI